MLIKSLRGNQKDCLMKVLNLHRCLIIVINNKMPVKFDESCLKKEKIVFTDNTIQNGYTVYKINLWPLHLDSKFTFKFTEIRYLELLS